MMCDFTMKKMDVNVDRERIKEGNCFKGYHRGPNKIWRQVGLEWKQWSCTEEERFRICFKGKANKAWWQIRSQRRGGKKYNQGWMLAFWIEGLNGWWCHVLRQEIQEKNQILWPRLNILIRVNLFEVHSFHTQTRANVSLMAHLNSLFKKIIFC